MRAIIPAMLIRALALAALTAPVTATAEPIEVDIELFLAVDVSRSMAPFELEIQRRGYAAALTSPEVLNAIQSGMLGRIAVTYVEWAGSWTQRVVIPWTILESPEQAAALAEHMTMEYTYGMRRTSISGALDYAVESIETNEFQGLRRVIDVSGDGPNNDGGPVAAARDRAVERGIIINGLPLMTRDTNTFRWFLEELDWYYEDCVIGGPGAFVIAVTEWDQFAEAVRRKLVLELAGEPVWRLMPAQARRPMDCLIGEKMRDQRERIFNDP